MIRKRACTIVRKDADSCGWPRTPGGWLIIDPLTKQGKEYRKDSVEHVPQNPFIMAFDGFVHNFYLDTTIKNRFMRPVVYLTVGADILTHTAEFVEMNGGVHEICLFSGIWTIPAHLIEGGFSLYIQEFRDHFCEKSSMRIGSSMIQVALTPALRDLTQKLSFALSTTNHMTITCVISEGLFGHT